MTARIIVEIGEYRHPASMHACAPFRPRIENGIGIPSRITFRTREADLKEGPTRSPACGGTCHVMETHRYLMLGQQREHVIAIPTWIAKLDDVHRFVRQRVKERFETFEIAGPSRR